MVTDEQPEDPREALDDRRKRLYERFEAKYVPEPNSGCWLWDGAVGGSGYGKMGLGRRGEGTMSAHRVAYMLHVGPIAAGLCVLHRCDVPACVNPDHLWLGTHAENQADMARKGRSARGERHGQTRLTASIVRQIRASDGTCRTVGRRLGVSAATISQIRTRKVWRHVE